MKTEKSLDKDKEYIITSAGPIEINDDYLEEKEQTAWQKNKKAIILFIIAGPWMSMIMIPYMVIKFIAKQFSITLTGSMAAYFGIKVCLTTGFYYLYKKTFHYLYKNN